MMDHGHLAFATSTEQKYLKAILSGKSYRKVAKDFGVSSGTVGQAMQRLKRRGAKRGYSPEHGQTQVVPETQYISGVSTQYDAAGNIAQQWVKTSADRETLAVIAEEVAECFAERVRPVKKTKVPKRSDDSLLSVYPMGDPHIGMYAWREEVGEDFDVDIASRLIRETVARLVEASPESERALVVNLGDFFHCDSLDNRTRASGNVLDVDTRWSKVLQVGVDTITSVIDMALQKHRKVFVMNAIGNHDEHTSMMLSLMLSAYYRKEPRVEIDVSPSMFRYFRFCKCLIGVTHGHTVKAHSLGEIMATDRAEDWGETVHRMWLTGHVHHDSRKELRGCTVETFRTVAGKDAWHFAHGYRASRDMQLIVLHDLAGEIERHRVGVD